MHASDESLAQTSREICHMASQYGVWCLVHPGSILGADVQTILALWAGATASVINASDTSSYDGVVAVDVAWERDQTCTCCLRVSPEESYETTRNQTIHWMKTWQ
jgi:hypothetical protein